MNMNLAMCPQALSFLIQYCFMLICFVATVYFVVFVSMCSPSICTVVTLYLWGANLQAQPSVQPLSLMKIENNNISNKFPHLLCS